MTRPRGLGHAVLWLGAAVLLGWVAAGASFAQDESPPADAPELVGAALSGVAFNFFTDLPYGTTGKAKFLDSTATWSRDPETGHWLYTTTFMGAAIPTQAGAGGQAAIFSTTVVVDIDPEGGPCHTSSGGLYPIQVPIDEAKATFADADAQSEGADTGSDESGVDTSGADTSGDQSGQSEGAATCPVCGSPLGSNPNCPNCVLNAHDPTSDEAGADTGSEEGRANPLDEEPYQGPDEGGANPTLEPVYQGPD